MKNKKILLLVIIVLSITLVTWAQTKAKSDAAPKKASATVTLYELDTSTSGKKGVVGNATLSLTDKGIEISVVFTKPVPDGSHGLHIHEGTSIEPAANAEGKMAAGMAAKGHYDPAGTKAHLGPNGKGHLGDLPLLVIKNNKVVGSPLIAPNITSLDDIYGKVLMIHQNGDNYSDTPAALGGGGPRWVAGIIEKK